MLEEHPLASMFPMIEGPAFDDLVSSIRSYGLINPIVLLDGKILDGRNRYRACQVAGVEPHFMNNEEVDPARWRALVDALNVQRRHLTESQRALLGAELQRSGSSRSEASQRMSIGTRTLEKGIAVLKSNDSNVISLVATGKVSLHRAEQVVKGKLPVTKMLATQRGGERTKGNIHVQRFEKLMDSVAFIAMRKEAIVQYWKGDPFTNQKLTEAIAFLSEVRERTREADRADTVA